MINNDVKCCTTNDPVNPKRRRVFQIAAAGVATGLTGLGLPAYAAPAVGDRLVLDDVEGDPVALKVGDLKVGKPVVAFTFDPATKAVRNDSRLHKVTLIKFEESQLDDQTKALAAGGVLAFSAICTHQACEVKTWIAKEKALVCYCHSTKFLPLEAGKVESGPAPRALPSLPLKLDGEQIVVAGAFSTPPGSAV